MATALASTVPPVPAAPVPAAPVAAGRRRVPTAARVLRAEVLRGSAPLTGVATTVALAYGVFFSYDSWGGTWLELGLALRSSLVNAGPVIVAGAAWAAGRERRRGMGELLGSTARPPWRRIVVGWGAVTLTATLGMVAVWAAAATLIAPVATFDGGRVWHPLAAVLSIGTLAAAGTAIGTLVAWRGAAPVAAIGAFYLLALMASGQIDDGRMWLSPSLPPRRAGSLDLHADGAMLEIVWFAALAATLLTVTGARRRAWALAPALLAIAAAVPLLDGPGQDRWPLSADATREVCRGDVPRVCTPQISAFLLDDLEAKVDALWPRLAGLEGAPTEFRATLPGAVPVDSAAVSVDLGSDLRGGTRWLSGDIDLFMNAAAPRCLSSSDRGPGVPESDLLAAHFAAVDVLSGTSGSSFSLDPVSEVTRARVTSALEALPVDEQRAWLGRYLTAARSTGPCDEAELDALLAVS